MMLYNTVNNPVVITIGDKIYRMERDSELEVAIPEGEYYIRIERLDRKGRALANKSVPGSANDAHASVTLFCLGMTGLLTLRRNTRIYVHEKQDRMKMGWWSRKYELLSFRLVIENGELDYRKDGCVDAETRNRMKRNFIRGLFIMAGVYLLVMIPFFLLAKMSMKGVHQAGELQSMIGYVMYYGSMAIVVLGCIGWNLFGLNYAPLFDQLPLLPDRSYYDYL